MGDSIAALFQRPTQGVYVVAWPMDIAAIVSAFFVAGLFFSHIFFVPKIGDQLH